MTKAEQEGEETLILKDGIKKTTTTAKGRKMEQGQMLWAHAEALNLNLNAHFLLFFLERGEKQKRNKRSIQERLFPVGRVLHQI